MEVLTSRQSKHYGASEYHRILATIHPKCYVECMEQQRGGTITKVVRDKWGVPIALYVTSGRGEDCINMTDIDFFEPYYYASLVFVDEDRFYTMLHPRDGKPERTW